MCRKEGKAQPRQGCSGTQKVDLPNQTNVNKMKVELEISTGGKNPSTTLNPVHDKSTQQTECASVGYERPTTPPCSNAHCKFGATTNTLGSIIHYKDSLNLPKLTVAVMVYYCQSPARAGSRQPPVPPAQGFHTKWPKLLPTPPTAVTPGRQDIPGGWGSLSGPRGRDQTTLGKVQRDSPCLNEAYLQPIYM